jgi:hypothetical protein
MINCCASVDRRPGPDYVALYSNVAKAMNQKVKTMTPPIVFVQDSRVLGQMFPELSKPGENLFGVYWCGMIYLSQEDLSNQVVTHEFAHYLGANEQNAEIVASACTHQKGVISPESKKSGEVADLIGVPAGKRGARAAGVRSPTNK